MVQQTDGQLALKLWKRKNDEAKWEMLMHLQMEKPSVDQKQVKLKLVQQSEEAEKGIKFHCHQTFVK